MVRKIAVELDVRTGQGKAALNAFSRQLEAVQKQAALGNRLTDAATGRTFGMGISGFGNVDPSTDNNLQARINRQRSSLQALGNTMKIASDISLQYGKGQELLFHNQTLFTGNLKQYIAAQEKYGQVLERQIGLISRYKAAQAGLKESFERTQGAINLRGGAAQQAKTEARERIRTANDAVTTAKLATQIARDELASLTSLPKTARAISVKSLRESLGDDEVEKLFNAYPERFVRGSTASKDKSLLRAGIPESRLPGFEDSKGILTIYKDPEASDRLKAATQRVVDAEAAEARTIAESTTERKAAKEQLKRAQADERRAISDGATVSRGYADSKNRLFRGLIDSFKGTGGAEARAEIERAFNAPPPLPRTFTALPRQIQQDLLREGLGTSATGARPAVGTPEFARNFAAQGGLGFNLEKDLVRQVNRVSGSFEDFRNGQLKRFSAEFTDSGRVITRFGGQLSGIGNILSQVGRDFQKVIEFAVATTVVFGTLQYSIQEISKITALDKSIRQLTITAGLTREQGLSLFGDIADIAIATATPVEELVKATDDIALATRRAGQGTDEWRNSILSLTNSVGILTNLAGIDTVKATDLLVASMKQLDLQANQLPGLLNKVTAVAGGQSNAIADIITGLGAMSEAGKQAGLSIDQMIATVQVLSQVTSKTPAEVATSFKNLVGALSGPAGSKALEKYNIALIDSGGNLRNILDIYGEIADKIKSGIIPQNQVQAVVRAIAGGPRRAPDAAALLGNIGDIEGVVTRSVNATNEALIANAKILDTTSAKLTIIQARIDKFAVTKFAAILRGVSDSLLDVVEVVLSVIERIPPGLVVAVVQFGLLAAAIKLGSSVLRAFAISGAGTISTVRSLSGELKSLAIAQAQYNRTAGGIGPIPATKGNIVGGFLQNRGSALAGVALGGAITAGATAASGGNPLEIIGSGLQGAGLTAALFPASPPPVRAVAAAAALLGFALQAVAGANREVSTTQKESTEELLNAINAYKEAALNVETLQARQQELKDSIAEAQTQGGKEANQAILDYQKEYIENTVDMAKATNDLASSLEEIGKQAPNLPQYELQAARFGSLSADKLEELTRKLSVELLKQSNPEFTSPELLARNLPDLRRDVPFANAFGSTEAVKYQTRVLPPGATTDTSGRPQRLTFPVKIDLTSLSGIEDLNELKVTLQRIFEEGFTFEGTSENLDIISEALKRLKDNISPEDYAKLEQAFSAAVDRGNALVAIERDIAAYSAYLDAGAATGLFTQEEVNNGKALLEITRLIAQTASRNLPSAGTLSPDDRDTQATREGALNRAREIITDPRTGQLRTDITKEEALELAQLLLQSGDAAKTAYSEFEKLSAAAYFFNGVGVAVKGVTDNMAILKQQAAETNAELLDNDLPQLKNSLAGNIGDKLADLQSRKQGGEFSTPTEKQNYSEQLGQLTALQEQINAITGAVEGAASVVPNLDQQMQVLASSLTGINGLQDAQSLSTTQLIERLYELAQTYGLSGQQVDTLGGKIVGLINTVKKISDIKVKFNIGANVDLRQTLAALQAIRSTYLGIKGAGLAVPGVAQAIGNQVSELDQAIKDVKAAMNVGSSIETIFKGGGGSTYGKTPNPAAPKKPQGFDVSNLDLPESIANAPNRDALIQQAIRNARALQSKIPGATKEAKNDIVELLKGTQRILEVRGVKDDLLRKALEELADIEKKRLEFETKADIIRRIRVGGGDFSAIANVPLNSKTGVSLGGQDNINVTLNINGQVQTPAQLAQLAELIAAAIKRQIANG